jgi:hypothetical protein
MDSVFSIWASTLRVRLMSCAAIVCCATTAVATPPKKLHPLPFEAFDAEGKLVGSIIQDGSAKVAMTVEGKRYAVPLIPVPFSIGLMAFDTNLTRWYQGPHCSGSAYVALAEQVVPWAFAAIDQERVLLFRTVGTIETIVYGSYRSPDGSCNGRKGAAQLAPLQDPVDITDRYRLPFHAR